MFGGRESLAPHNLETCQTPQVLFVLSLQFHCTLQNKIEEGKGDE